MQTRYQEYSTVKVSVLVKQVNLKVSFPCKITYYLKTNAHNISKKSLSYELINHQSQPQQTVETEVQIDKKDGENFIEQNAELIFSVLSINGEVMIGSALIELIKNGKIIGLQQCQGQLMELNKCADQNAHIKIEIKTQIVSQEKRQVRESSENKLRLLQHYRSDLSDKNLQSPINMIKINMISKTPKSRRGRWEMNKSERKQELKLNNSCEDFKIDEEDLLSKKKQVQYFEHFKNWNDNHLRSKLKKADTEKMQQQKQILELKRQILAYKGSREYSSELGSELRLLNQQLKDTKNANFIFQQKERQLKQEIKRKDQVIAHLNQAKSSTDQMKQSEQKIKEESIQNTIKEMRVRIQNIQKQNQLLKIENKSLKRKQEVYEERFSSEMHELIKKNRQLEKQRMKLMEGFQDSLENFHETQINKHKQYLSKHQKYEEQIRGYRITIEELKRQLNIKNQEISEYKQKVESQVIKILELEQEVNRGSVKKLEELTLQNQQLIRNNSRMKSQQEEMLQENRRLIQQKNLLNQENKKLNESFRSQKQDFAYQINQLKSKLDSNQQEQYLQLNKIRQQLAMMQESNKDIAEELKNCLQGWQAQKTPILQNSLAQIMDEMSIRIHQKTVY